MLIRRMLVLAVAAVAVLLIGSGAVEAREILGCDGIIQFPCPGPAL